MKKKSNRDKIILATKIAGPGDYTKHIHTIFIWSSYFFMFYIVKFSIPETSNLDIEWVF